MKNLEKRFDLIFWNSAALIGNLSLETSSRRIRLQSNLNGSVLFAELDRVADNVKEDLLEDFRV